MEWRVAIFNAGIGKKMRGSPWWNCQGLLFVMVDSHRSMPRITNPADMERCQAILEKPSRNAPIPGVIFMLSSNIFAFQDMV
ncbi:hypothetical protein SAMN04488688_103521 [Paenibacillus sp. cl141a]|nr:hypothetical protein SAMN04488688_103521 [Paenibacillus sp. cl141a]